MKSFSQKPSLHYQWIRELTSSFPSQLMKSPKCDADRTPCEQIQAHSEGFWITSISMNNSSVTHVSSLFTNLHNLVTNPHKKRHHIEFWNCFRLITGFHNTKKKFHKNQFQNGEYTHCTFCIIQFPSYQHHIAHS